MAVTFRPAKPEDAPSVIALYAQTSRTLPLSFVNDCLENYPALLAIENENMIGFAYTKQFSPDILELSNIYLTSSVRDGGIGSQLLKRLEEIILEKTKFAAILAENSMLYENIDGKRPAIHFYAQNGYQRVAGTENTSIYFKTLKKP